MVTQFPLRTSHQNSICLLFTTGIYF